MGRLLAGPMVLMVGCVSPAAVRAVPEGDRPNALPAWEGGEVLQRFARTDSVAGQPAVTVIASAPEAEPVEGPETGGREVAALTFDEVLRSVELQFPLILAALQEVDLANAQLQSAEGGFDLAVKGESELSPQGYYENESTKLLLEQPTTAWGATVFGGYKRGTGDYPVWEGGYKTREEGEFSVGLRLPLLKGREIDPRRLALWQARLGQAQAEPLVLQKRLEATRKAALTYWKWVAAGQKLAIAERLLKLAEDRQGGIEVSVGEGQLPRLSIIENRRLVVERRSIVIRSHRVLQQAAIALSLFWRGPSGEPVIPDQAQLPAALPEPTEPDRILLQGDVELAVRSRPEVRGLELEAERLRLDLQGAENSLLPKLDVTVAGSKDVGGRVSNPDDKGPFALDVLLNFEVPIQRNTASGKVRALDAKAIQLARKVQFARESIIAEVLDGQSAVRQTWLRLAEAQENAKLAGQIEEAERIFLAEGQSDLLRVNLREQQTASAASMLVDVVAEHFQAVAEYRASLGVPYDEVMESPSRP